MHGKMHLLGLVTDVSQSGPTHSAQVDPWGQGNSHGRYKSKRAHDTFVRSILRKTLHLPIGQADDLMSAGLSFLSSVIALRAVLNQISQCGIVRHERTTDIKNPLARSRFYVQRPIVPSHFVCDDSDMIKQDRTFANHACERES